jgi:tetratricopeptide (TPR) repeat protein
MPNDQLDELRDEAKRLALFDNWGPQAIAINTQMIELDNRAADAYTRLAKCFLTQGRVSAAHDMYVEVLEFEPDNRIAYNNVSRLGKKIDRGLKLRAIASLENYDEAFSVGVAASRRKDFSFAIAALKRALELRPKSVYACNALGAAYRGDGMPSEARSIYQYAMKERENNSSLVGLAAVERDMRQYKEAIELYEKVLSSDSRNVYALNGLGGVYMDMEDYTQAEECFNKGSKVEGGIEDAVKNAVKNAVKGLEKLMKIYKENGEVESVERIRRWLMLLDKQRR